MFCRTADRVTRFTQSCRFGAFYLSIHIRPPILYSIWSKSRFFESLRFSLVLFVYSLFISIRVFMANISECRIKGSMFLKNRHFIFQERVNKLLYGINTIIKCGTWQPCWTVNFSFRKFHTHKKNWYQYVTFAQMWNLRMVNFDKFWGLKFVLKFLILIISDVWRIGKYSSHLWRTGATFSRVWRIGTNSSNMWRIDTNSSHMWRIHW